MYAVINSTTKKITKSYAVIGGATRKIKKIYGVINGVTKLIWAEGGKESALTSAICYVKITTTQTGYDGYRTDYNSIIKIQNNHTISSTLTGPTSNYVSWNSIIKFSKNGAFAIAQLDLNNLKIYKYNNGSYSEFQTITSDSNLQYASAGFTSDCNHLVRVYWTGSTCYREWYNYDSASNSFILYNTTAIYTNNSYTDYTWQSCESRVTSDANYIIAVGYASYYNSGGGYSYNYYTPLLVYKLSNESTGVYTQLVANTYNRISPSSITLSKDANNEQYLYCQEPFPDDAQYSTSVPSYFFLLGKSGITLIKTENVMGYYLYSNVFSGVEPNYDNSILYINKYQYSASAGNLPNGGETSCYANNNGSLTLLGTFNPTGTQGSYHYDSIVETDNQNHAFINEVNEYQYNSGSGYGMRTSSILYLSTLSKDSSGLLTAVSHNSTVDATTIKKSNSGGGNRYSVVTK
ncbi:MAG: hypothetical protein IJZ77_02700 [Bacilli bacterium]|nr:hypothetical protein [Bacilli bacterium]